MNIFENLCFLVVTIIVLFPHVVSFQFQKHRSPTFKVFKKSAAEVSLGENEKGYANDFTKYTWLSRDGQLMKDPKLLKQL